MNEVAVKHALLVGSYTYAGEYYDYFRSLPDDVSELGYLICSQIIHRVTLKEGNTNANASLLYGDMNLFPWHRLRCEDDVFLTATAMAAELFRLDNNGFTLNRKVEDKLVLTCRYVSVLMSSILKAKGIPCRCRSGFAPYFVPGKSVDHWVNQYFTDHWITFDADGFFDTEKLGFYQYDMPHEKFDFAADTWLKIRNGSEAGEKYINGGGDFALEAVVLSLFSDFHALMNNEISYKFMPAFIAGKFERLTSSDLAEIDDLANLMIAPDENFHALLGIWETRKKFRILNSPLVGDWDNQL